MSQITASDFMKKLTHVLETINMEKRQSLTMIFDSILLIFLSLFLN